MTTSTDQYTELFDRALVLRDEGEYQSAIAILEELVAMLPVPKHSRLKAHSLVQLARLYERCGRQHPRELHLRHAVQIAPKFELASLALFHALWDSDRRTDAIREMLRYLAIKDSPGYRELMNDGFASGLPAEERAVAEQAWGLLQRWN